MTKDELERQIWIKHLKEKGLKWTGPRETVFDLFVATEGHTSAEEIYEKLKKTKVNKIGLSTVYRTLKLLCEFGFAQEVNFGDGRRRFEHKYNHQHHDHLICLSCGSSIEFYTPKIEKFQEEVIKSHHFLAEKHKLEIYGYCEKCH